ncbi:MAG: signal peptidase I [Verrucomicrobiia bacterium]
MRTGRELLKAAGGRRLRLWVGIAFLTGLILLLRAHFMLAVTVGDSMLPTLKHREMLIVSRLAFRNAAPQRGDIVLARVGNELLVKRIVGLPEEEVAITRGTLLIGGRQYPEPYVQSGSLTIPQAKLRANQFALVGDNRALPEAMAIHGVAPKNAILGKVILSMRL